MAITSINVIQTNVIGAGYPVAVHNPLVYIVEANYTSTAPNLLYVSEAITNKVYSCIPYSDPQAGKRHFIFIADEIIRGMMGGFDDTVQGDAELVHRTNKTLEIEWRFYDPDDGDNEAFSLATFIHATRQFGEDPCIESLMDNDPETYNGVVGFPCYVYFFNSNALNVITVVES